MSVPFIDLVRQHKNLDKEIKVAVQKVFDHANFRGGKEVGAFEKAFAAYCGTKFCVGVGSGSDALLLSLQALGIGSGDEVITVPNTFISSVLPILQLGAKPILVDVDERTYQIDASKLKVAINKRTKAIIPVHLYGIPCPMDEILAIAKKHSLYVIEDACQAHGSIYKGKKCGSFGNLSAFSFYPAKNLGASGEGGAVVTNDKALADKVRILGHIGQKEKYKHELRGYNSHLDTIEAAVLFIKLKKLDLWNKRRRELAALYNNLLGDLPLVLPPKLSDGVIENCYVYVIRTPKRDQLSEFLQKRGISTVIHYPIPVHLQKAMSGLGYKKGSFPVTERHAKEVLSLPMFPEMTTKQVREVSYAIHKFFRRPKK